MAKTIAMTAAAGLLGLIGASPAPAQLAAAEREAIRAELRTAARTVLMAPERRSAC